MLCREHSLSVGALSHSLMTISKVERDEFTVKISHKPMGVQISALHGKTNDVGGILIVKVKDHGGFGEAASTENVRFERTVIIALGIDEDSLLNIELKEYNDALELLRNQPIPFTVSCKV